MAFEVEGHAKEPLPRRRRHADDEAYDGTDANREAEPQPSQQDAWRTGAVAAARRSWANPGHELSRRGGPGTGVPPPFFPASPSI